MQFVRALLAIALVCVALFFGWRLFLLVLLSWPGNWLQTGDWGQVIRNGSIALGAIVVSLTLAWRIWPRRKLSHRTQTPN